VFHGRAISFRSAAVDSLGGEEPAQPARARLRRGGWIAGQGLRPEEHAEEAGPALALGLDRVEGKLLPAEKQAGHSRAGRARRRGRSWLGRRRELLSLEQQLARQREVLPGGASHGRRAFHIAAVTGKPRRREKFDTASRIRCPGEAGEAGLIAINSRSGRPAKIGAPPSAFPV